MTNDEVVQWVLAAPFDKLEHRIRNFSRLHQAYALDWARELFKNLNGNEAQIKLAVAVIGTLAPSELDDE